MTSTTRKYAEGTEVPVSRSRDEIERMIRERGGINFVYGIEEDADEPFAWIRFKLRGYVLRFRIALPDLNDRAFTHDTTGYRRTANQTKLKRDQEERRRWRELVLLLKAKLISLDSPVVSFEQEFLSYIVLDSDQTVGEWAIPRLHEKMRDQIPLLPAPKYEE